MGWRIVMVKELFAQLTFTTQIFKRCEKREKIVFNVPISSDITLSS